MENSLSFNYEDESSASSQEPINNSIANWTVTFYALYKAAIAGKQIYNENKHIIIAYKLKGFIILPLSEDYSEAIAPLQSRTNQSYS